MPEHPLYAAGLADADSSVLEVLESTWLRELTEQTTASALRIWGARGMKPGWSRTRPSRHFLVALKESTFECIAAAMVVERFCASFDEAFAHVRAKLKEH